MAKFNDAVSARYDIKVIEIKYIISTPLST